VALQLTKPGSGLCLEDLDYAGFATGGDELTVGTKRGGVGDVFERGDGRDGLSGGERVVGVEQGERSGVCGREMVRGLRREVDGGHGGDQAGDFLGFEGFPVLRFWGSIWFL